MTEQPTAAPAGAAGRRGGFTLLELLVVIAIIGLLVVAFGPALTNALGAGDEATTKARQVELVSMIEAYQRTHGDYPPDDLSSLQPGEAGSWQFGTDNGKNTGIESLVVHLSLDGKSGGRLDEHEDWLSNTDGDKAEAVIPQLQRRDKVEVVDAWGTPFAYFSARTGSAYQGRQTVVGRQIEGVAPLELRAEPWKNPANGAWLNPRKFQLISAGPDLEFNTDDDLVFPEVPKS